MTSNMHIPAVGPLVGHTGSNMSRLWIQAVASPELRTVGVAALYDASGKYIEHSIRYFRLRRRDDRTGVVDFGGLEPGSVYRVRLGVMVQDKALSHASGDEAVMMKLPPVDSLRLELECLNEADCMASFRTFPEPGNKLSFIFGSCRYPGLLWPASKADRIFGAMHQQFRSGRPPSFLLMNGDQIYADKLTRRWPLFRARSEKDFRSRYVEAFSTRHMSALLREVPVYMMLDDHEIEDGWNVSRLDDNPELFEAAMQAYRRYQWLHSPRNYAEQGEVAAGAGDKYYYSFECGGYPFFVMDSRTERIQDDERCDLVANHLLGDPLNDAPQQRAQLPLLCEWLVRQQQLHGNRAKFIVSPDMFLPNERVTAGNSERALQAKCRDDAWAAFPGTRRKLLQAIVAHGVQNVVFLCGDAHCSSAAEIYFMHKEAGRLPLRAYSITSSAFYWPWPFGRGRARDYVQDSVVDDDLFNVNADVVMHYQSLGFTETNNFTRVDLHDREIRISQFGSGGEAIGEVLTLDLS